MKKKIFIAVLFMGLLSGLLGGCGKQEKPKNAAENTEVQEEATTGSEGAEASAEKTEETGTEEDVTEGNITEAESTEMDGATAEGTQTAAADISEEEITEETDDLCGKKLEVLSYQFVNNSGHLVTNPIEIDIKDIGTCVIESQVFVKDQGQKPIYWLLHHKENEGDVEFLLEANKQKLGAFLVAPKEEEPYIIFLPIPEGMDREYREFFVIGNLQYVNPPEDAVSVVSEKMEELKYFDYISGDYIISLYEDYGYTLDDTVIEIFSGK